MNPSAFSATQVRYTPSAVEDAANLLYADAYLSNKVRTLAIHAHGGLAALWACRHACLCIDLSLSLSLSPTNGLR
jgi:hypothetical protein